MGRTRRIVRGGRRVLAATAPWLTDVKQSAPSRRAGIARAADVPVGNNVYYYFKTKDELVKAAIAGHTNDVHAVLDSLERHSTPQARLKALLRALTDQSELTAPYGCPLGSLCSELDKCTDGLDQTAAQMLRLPVDWAEQQFRLMAGATPAASRSR
jgi:TetR/AcrR family transcriptional regulator, transcriptional repressor for nem operon